MKKNIVFLILLGFFSITFSQDTTIIFLDSLWNKTKDVNSTYYRKKVRNKDKTYTILDYYRANNQLQMSGQYLDKYLKKETGEFVFYFEDGSISSKRNYMEGKLEGIQTFYWSDGNIKKLVNYKNDKYHEECTWYHNNGQIASKELYYYGVLKTIEQWDKDGKLLKDPKVEIEAAYPGGEEELIYDINLNLIYPKSDVDKDIEGKVLISFVIEKDGSMSNFEIVESPSNSLGKAGLETVQKLKKWSPEKSHNLPIRVKYTLPIEFKLERID